MASSDPYDIDPRFLSATPADTGMGVPASDYLKQAYTAVQGVGAYGPALRRYIIGDPENEYEQQRLKASQWAQEQVRNAQAQTAAGMATDTKAAANATFGSSEFWSQPFAWTGLQIAGTAPSVAAAVVGGAMSGGAMGALIAAGGISGGFSVGDYLEAAQQSIDERSDSDLRKVNPLYKQMREGGMPEEQARAHITQEITKNTVPLLFAVGVATGAAGLPGQALRAIGPAAVRQGLAREVPRNFLKRVGQEAGIGAGTEAAQTFTESLVGQNAAVSAGYQPSIDVGLALQQSAGAGVVGGILGGATGFRPDYQPPSPALPPGAAATGGAAAGAAAPTFPIGPIPPGTLPGPGVQGALPLGPGGRQQALPLGSPQVTPVGTPNAAVLSALRASQGAVPASQPDQMHLPFGQQELPLTQPPTQLPLPLQAPPQPGQPGHQPTLPFNPDQSRPPGTSPPMGEPTQQELFQPEQQPLPLPEPVPRPTPELANLGPRQLSTVTDDQLAAQDPEYFAVLQHFRKFDPETLRQGLNAAIGAEPGDPQFLQPAESAAMKQVVAEWDDSLVTRLTDFLIERSGLSQDDYADMHAAHSQMDDDQLRSELARQFSAGSPQELLRQVSALREMQRRAPPVPEPGATFSPEEAAAGAEQKAVPAQNPTLRFILSALQSHYSPDVALPSDLSNEEILRLIEGYQPGLSDQPVSTMLETMQQSPSAQLQRQAGYETRIREAEQAPEYGGEQIMGAPAEDVTPREALEAEQKRSHKKKTEQVARADEDQKTAVLFQQFGNYQGAKGTRTQRVSALRDYLKGVVDAARENGIKRRRTIDYEGTAKETFWLQEARRVYDFLTQGDQKNATDAHVNETDKFAANTFMAFHNDDWSGFRKSRKEGGEEQKGKSTSGETVDEEGRSFQLPQTIQHSEEGEPATVGMFEAPEAGPAPKAKPSTEAEIATEPVRAHVAVRKIGEIGEEDTVTGIPIIGVSRGPPIKTRTTDKGRKLEGEEREEASKPKRIIKAARKNLALRRAMKPAAAKELRKKREGSERATAIETRETKGKRRSRDVAFELGYRARATRDVRPLEKIHPMLKRPDLRNAFVAGWEQFGKQKPPSPAELARIEGLQKIRADKTLTAAERSRAETAFLQRELEANERFAAETPPPAKPPAWQPGDPPLGPFTRRTGWKGTSGTWKSQLINKAGRAVDADTGEMVRTEPTFAWFFTPDKAVTGVTRQGIKERIDVAAVRGEKPGKAKVIAEEAKINTNATLRQRLADVYKKGHLRIFGLDISLEVPRLGIRRSTDPANPWWVRMFTPYGAIRGTTSTDGANLDVYLGPKAYPGSLKLKKPVAEGETMPITQLAQDPKTPVYVIEQHHVYGEKTGTFDEHKVMLGFDSWEKAKAAYIKSFADGPTMGELRIGDYRPMSRQQFQNWVTNPQRTTHPLAWEPQNVLNKYWQRGTGVSHSIDPETWAAMSPEEKLAVIANSQFPDEGTRQLANYIVGNVPEKLSQHLSKNIMDTAVAAFPQHLQARVQRIVDRIAALSQDVPVHVLDDALYNKFQPNSRGAYNSDFDTVVLPQRMLGTTVVLHEAGHAAIMQTVHKNPQLKAEGDALLDDVLMEAARQDVNHYGISNLNELTSEIFNNEHFRNFLRDSEPKLNLWQRIKRWMAKTLGFKPQDTSLLERVLGFIEKAEEQAQPFERGQLATPELMQSIGETKRRGAVGVARAADMARSAKKTRAFEPITDSRVFGPMAHSRASDLLHEAAQRAQSRLPHRLGGPDRQEQTGVPYLLSLLPTFNIVQKMKDFGVHKEGLAISDAAEMQRVLGEKLARQHEATLDKFHKLQIAYQRSPALQQTWQEFISLLHDESKYEVYADQPLAAQPHLFDATGLIPKIKYAQGRRQHARLQAELNAMPDELKDARRDAQTLYAAMQTDMRDALGTNKMARLIAGPVNTALLGRILSDTETPADIIAAGGQDNVDDIKLASHITDLKGPYYPFIRRGTHVVQATYKIRAPLASQASPVAGTANTFDFTGPRAQANAEAYAGSVDPKAFVTKRLDPAGDIYRVRVQDKHVEFLDSSRQAAIRAKEMEADIGTLFTDVSGVEEKLIREHGFEAVLTNTAFKRMLDRLENSDHYKALPAHERRIIRESLTYGAMQALATTRVAASRMPRGYVEGMSRDFVQNMFDYSQSVAAQIAKLKHQPARDAAMNALKDKIQSVDRKGSEARSAIYNELLRRQTIADKQGAPSWVDGIVHDIAQLTFTYFLGSPAYSLNNLLQVPMVTGPHLGAEYGIKTASAAITQAYQDISAFRLLRAGIKATGKRFLNKGTGNLIDDMINGARLTPAEVRMLRYMEERGVLGSEAGLELGRSIRSPGAISTGLNWLTELARAMPRHAEAINRAVASLAAYRLELQRNGGDHDAAVLKAQEATILTHGYYSASDAAPIFNTKGGQMTLIFRKFGQLMYGLMGQHIGRALRAETPAERNKALLSLGYLLAAHVVVAGSLGLPNDPFKALLMGLNAAGIYDLTWSDVEFAQRQLATSIFGGLGGELITRGLPRLTGIDLSSRLGLQDLFLYGEPRDMGDPESTSAYLWDIFGGAGFGMLGNFKSGIQDFVSGDILKGAEKLSPLKALGNSIKAYRIATEGTQTESGYPILDPSGLGTALMQSFGYTPAYQAEIQEGRTQFFRQKKVLDKDRNDHIHDWQKASPSKRTSIWVNQIVPWNRSQPRDVQITQADLASYAKRRASENTIRGIRLTRTSRDLYQRTQSAYPSVAL